MKEYFNTYLILHCIILPTFLVSISSFPSLAEASTRHKELIRVKLGEIQNIEASEHQFALRLSSSTTITAHYSETTEFYTGTGEQVDSTSLHEGYFAYIFGNISSSTTSMKVEKVVYKNKSKLTRKSQKAPSNSLISWMQQYGTTIKLQPVESYTPEQTINPRTLLSKLGY
jgi:hypothetical protein